MTSRIKYTFVLAFCTALGGVGAGAQSTAAMAREVASVKAAVQQISQDHEQLLTLLEENRRAVSSIIKRLDALEAKVARRDGQSNGATAAVSEEIRGLRAEIAAERRAREKAIEELIRSISREISQVSNSAGPATGGGNSVPSQGVYTVVAGDTLSVIAQAFGISVNSLKQANNLDSDMIRVGQKLTIPAH